MGKRIAVIGGGPAGLYFSVLAKRLDPSHDITVWERNAPDDTFGFGVVFSDETLSGIANADPEFYARCEAEFAKWSDIDIWYGGERTTVGGQVFAAASRKLLLQLLQERARQLGVELHFRTEAPDVAELAAEYDLVIAADGINSRVRPRYPESFKPSLDPRRCKYMWLGLDRALEAFTFWVKQTEWGVMQVHAYPYSATQSTFLVEMPEETWRRAGFDASEASVFPPGVSDDASVARIADIFSEELAGARLLTNNSKWITFNTVRNECWRHDNVVLLGDAAHTAHFSIGSGTKLALEDALALAANLHERPDDIPGALAAYEEERRPVVLSIQRAAQASLEWFENLGQYTGQSPVQFAFNLLTRSRRITFENLRVRDAAFAGAVQSEFASGVASGEGGGCCAGGGAAGPVDVAAPVPAMFQPLRLRQLTLKNRIIVSPMDMYSAVDGVVNDFHLVHLGSRAVGGAGLVMTEMVAPSADGRISLGDAGLYTDEQRDAWARVVNFVHTVPGAAIGVQLGHSGRKGSTKRMWEGIDDPLAEGGWEVIAPSAIPYGEGSNVPREMTRADMERVIADYVAATHRAAAAGFDLLELHAAHGYLLSSFISPLANQRTDEYGGSLEARLRFPLEVFAAVREAWPEERPMSVRISATDWASGGITPEDAVEVARAFIAAGADAIDVSSGQVVKHEHPAYGRSYQTPFADMIRNRVARQAGAAVFAVGAISSFDDVNSLLYAGRADAVAIGRTHLWDPHWTLHAAADQEYRGEAATWIPQYVAGRRKPPQSRTDAVRPRLELLSGAEEAPTHVRWIGGESLPQ